MATGKGIDREGFTTYEKMPEDTNCWMARGLKSIKRWVATEKVHGANFSFTVSDREGARVAKRGGYLKEGERFFGVHRQRGFLTGEQEKAQAVFQAVKDFYKDIHSITIYGELFGDYLDYDVCMQLFKTCGLLYAEPLCTGTLQDMLAYPLGFPSKLPGKFGLPPLDGRRNTAEGIVIKPLKSAMLDTNKGPRRVIFKRKVENFQEKKDRRQQIAARGGGKKEYDGELEAFKYELYSLVTEQRVVNTVSKLGMPESDEEWEALVEELVSDVMEEVGELDVDGLEKYQRDPIKMEEVMEGLNEGCKQAVQDYRDSIG